MMRRNKIRICIDLDDETIARLASKYGNISYVLEQAAKQLAQSENESIHEIARYLDMFTLIDQAMSTIKDIVHDIKYIQHNIPPNTRLDKIAHDIMSVKVMILMQIIKKLKKAAPPVYKKMFKEIEREILEWSITYKSDNYANT